MKLFLYILITIISIQLFLFAEKMVGPEYVWLVAIWPAIWFGHITVLAAQPHYSRL